MCIIGIRTRNLMCSNLQLYHCAASGNTSVPFLALITTIDRNLCPARPRHLAAGVGHPARGPPRHPPRP